ncbi:hypothetical protein RDWZM_010033 [Blomia tropicalis]|uniref:Uncharacterized protein n=1 Tax=Blomia tropicalis TaxID=40697 RepID=A0A9Q0LYN0_BLOTA|nr:hypothetical protein BLOT_012913 [Blomia tropicalis]KAJ6215533.1 hypothetical protein RDWZM_010033 [Blomia tropicalis]
MKLSIIILSTILSASLFELVRSECCYAHFNCKEPDNAKVSRCYDCTVATPFCGVGKCNILGCNCDNGCRHGDESLWCWNPVYECGKTELRSIINNVQMSSVSTQQQRTESIVSSLVERYDQNGDRSLDINEFHSYWLDNVRMSTSMIKVEFAKIDTDRNGRITMNEIDRSIVV